MASSSARRRPIGVVYQAGDPAGTARANTFWTNWAELLGMVWLGLAFSLVPFFGFRGVVRGGRA